MPADAGLGKFPSFKNDNAAMSAIPLSFAQERLWVLHRILPAASLYNVAKGVHLRGMLDQDALVRDLMERLSQAAGPAKRA